MNCISLETVDLRTVTQIGDGCFGGCENLKSIIGLETSREYGSNVFSDCPNLVISEVGGAGREMFSMCHSIINVVFNGNTLGSGAFMHCLNLESFECQGNIQSIPEKCFYGCIKLINVVLPQSVTKIGNYAFFNTSLRNGFTFDNIRKVGDLSFAYCHLQIVTIFDIRYEYEQKYQYIMQLKDREDIVYVAPFKCCNDLTKVVFKVTSQPPMTGFFDQCDNLVEIEVISDNFIFENGVIYDNTKSAIVSFSNVLHLESFIIPETITRIYDLAFYGTKYLKNLKCNHCVIIGAAAFLKSSLENIIFTDPLNNYIMSVLTFSYSLSLKYVEIKCQQFQIFDFLYCINLEYFKAPITQLSPGLFMYCKSLKEIDLKEISLIGPKTFLDCHSLKRIEFGQKIEQISQYAFKNCINLETVIFDQLSRLTIINFGTFQNCIHLTSIILPLGLRSIYDLAFSNTALKEIRIPTLTEVTSHAFDDTPDIKVINTVVYDHEFIMYKNNEKSFVTTIGKQNTTYKYHDGFTQFDPLLINSNHVFNETIGAYENDLGIRTLIIPESIHEMNVNIEGYKYNLGLHFIENICYDGIDLELYIPYNYVFEYFDVWAYDPMDWELQGIGPITDLDGPFPYPKIYAPNMKVEAC
ncbi:surface antigen BspA-like [Trichomonas vaginalis G3]|uniref:Surface antigen BspA-like n=1 Tax=Trichomonas vaginalis (strain ATCC PRA-98 / G3) TaxID=412133 RepID=A2EDL6_TRIV3|nr:antigen BSP-related family [Trichomonas vaginalis G3]EAY09281.1 surface antigen BspA-like [Trichomonas vaginalis G3]KAI5484068.1 antigen BSP-related family [Trichomonas vaginalis G3]|eukprot:XP_001321504.1 surface antigen BspA-like [Trichomonas vaginalis G3]